MSDEPKLSEEQLRRDFERGNLPVADPGFRFDRLRWASRHRRPVRGVSARRARYLWEGSAAAVLVALVILGHVLGYAGTVSRSLTHTPGDRVVRIVARAVPNPVTAGDTVRVAGTAFLPGGRRAADSRIQVGGLPADFSGRAVVTNVAGQFAFSIRWHTPGAHTLMLRDGSARVRVAVVVEAAEPLGLTPPFAGSQVQFHTNGSIPPAIPAGFSRSRSSPSFSARTYHLVEGFTGTLAGHPFILDIYADPSRGLFIGLNYNHRPLRFGPGPSPVFDVLNFTGDWLVVGSPSAGAYEALNLVTGRALYRARQVVPLKGYRGLAAPQHVLGLAGIQAPVAIPYGSAP